MIIDVLTLFPEYIDSYFKTSLVGKAVEQGIIVPRVVNIRDFADDRYGSCDDYTYGGGSGMVLKPEVLKRGLDSIGGLFIRTVYPDPAGRPFDQRTAENLSRETEIAFICGRYEGIDNRIIETYVNDSLSIGDYVLSSGELAALVIIDACVRLLPGVINVESLREESFNDGLLEYPHYTRPSCFMGLGVPGVLLSGNHAEIAEWRQKKRIERTGTYRPDLKK